jgi:hypothetical protein
VNFKVWIYIQYIYLYMVYETFSVLLSICALARAVQAMCKYGRRIVVCGSNPI